MKGLYKGVAVFSIVAVTLTLSVSVALANGGGFHRFGGVTIVKNSNGATVINEVSSAAFTGTNSANKNKGNVDINIDTEDANSTETVKNVVNTNKTMIDLCGCRGRKGIVVVKNGNGALVSNGVGSLADTGANEANDNKAEGHHGHHGGGHGGHGIGNVTVDIDTGNANSVARVFNRVNTNLTRIRR